MSTGLALYSHGISTALAQGRRITPSSRPSANQQWNSVAGRTFQGSGHMTLTNFNHGIREIESLPSCKLRFQCLRYQAGVSDKPLKVRDVGCRLCRFTSPNRRLVSNTKLREPPISSCPSPNRFWQFRQLQIACKNTFNLRLTIAANEMLRLFHLESKGRHRTCSERPAARHASMACSAARHY